MIKELTANNFDRRFAPFITRISKRQKWARPFDPDHFFATVKDLMEKGTLRVWRGERALLGGMIVPHLFTGGTVGIVSFWWSEQSPDSVQLFKHFEAVAKDKGCDRVYAAVFGDVRGKAIERLYNRMGYGVIESTVWKLF